MKACDLFALPSRWEGMPNAALEATAVGLPCVVSTRAGCGQWIRSGRTGWVFGHESSSELAEAITDALDHPQEARDRADRAVSIVRRQFAPEKVASRMIEVYHMAMNA